jgi:hypothetical protein
MVGRGKPFPDLFLHAAKTWVSAFQLHCHRGQRTRNSGRRGHRHGGLLVLRRSAVGSRRACRGGGILFDDMRDLSAMIGLAQSSTVAGI